MMLPPKNLPQKAPRPSPIHVGLVAKWGLKAHASVAQAIALHTPRAYSERDQLIAAGIALHLKRLEDALGVVVHRGHSRRDRMQIGGYQRWAGHGPLVARRPRVRQEAPPRLPITLQLPRHRWLRLPVPRPAMDFHPEVTADPLSRLPARVAGRMSQSVQVPSLLLAWEGWGIFKHHTWGVLQNH
jgi:hypothetical protein